MDQHIPQNEIRRIISDMMKKRISIVPVIGEDTIVYSFGVPFVLRWLFQGTLKWVRCKFLDEPSARSTFGRLQGKKAEREESSMVMKRYKQLMGKNIIHSKYI